MACYVIPDTNVLLTHPHILHIVRHLNITENLKVYSVLPWTVISELDAIKDNKNRSKSQMIVNKARRSIKIMTNLLKNKKPCIFGQPTFIVKSEINVNNNDDRIINCVIQINMILGDFNITPQQKPLHANRVPGIKNNSVLFLSQDRNLIGKAVVNDIICSQNPDDIETMVREFFKTSDVNPVKTSIDMENIKSMVNSIADDPNNTMDDIKNLLQDMRYFEINQDDKIKRVALPMDVDDDGDEESLTKSKTYSPSYRKPSPNLNIIYPELNQINRSFTQTCGSSPKRDSLTYCNNSPNRSSSPYQNYSPNRCSYQNRSSSPFRSYSPNYPSSPNRCSSPNRYSLPFRSNSPNYFSYKNRKYSTFRSHSPNHRSSPNMCSINRCSSPLSESSPFYTSISNEQSNIDKSPNPRKRSRKKSHSRSPVQQSTLVTNQLQQSSLVRNQQSNPNNTPPSNNTRSKFKAIATQNSPPTIKPIKKPSVNKVVTKRHLPIRQKTKIKNSADSIITIKKPLKCGKIKMSKDLAKAVQLTIDHENKSKEVNNIPTIEYIFKYNEGYMNDLFINRDYYNFVGKVRNFVLNITRAIILYEFNNFHNNKRPDIFEDLSNWTYESCHKIFTQHVQKRFLVNNRDNGGKKFRAILVNLYMIIRDKSKVKFRIDNQEKATNLVSEIKDLIDILAYMPRYSTINTINEILSSSHEFIESLEKIINETPNKPKNHNFSDINMTNNYNPPPMLSMMPVKFVKSETVNSADSNNQIHTFMDTSANLFDKMDALDSLPGSSKATRVQYVEGSIANNAPYKPSLAVSNKSKTIKLNKKKNFQTIADNPHLIKKIKSSDRVDLSRCNSVSKLKHQIDNQIAKANFNTSNAPQTIINSRELTETVSKVKHTLVVPEVDTALIVPKFNPHSIVRKEPLEEARATTHFPRAMPSQMNAYNCTPPARTLQLTLHQASPIALAQQINTGSPVLNSIRPPVAHHSPRRSHYGDKHTLNQQIKINQNSRSEPVVNINIINNDLMSNRDREVEFAEKRQRSAKRLFDDLAAEVQSNVDAVDTRCTTQGNVANDALMPGEPTTLCQGNLPQQVEAKCNQNDNPQAVDTTNSIKENELIRKLMSDVCKQFTDIINTIISKTHMACSITNFDLEYYTLSYINILLYKDQYMKCYTCIYGTEVELFTQFTKLIHDILSTDKVEREKYFYFMKNLDHSYFIESIIQQLSTIIKLYAEVYDKLNDKHKKYVDQVKSIQESRKKF